jgi:hypothetical protein
MFPNDTAELMVAAAIVLVVLWYVLYRLFRVLGSLAGRLASLHVRGRRRRPPSTNDLV